MAVKGSEGTINLSIFFVTTILTTTFTSVFTIYVLGILSFMEIISLFMLFFNTIKIMVCVKMFSVKKTPVSKI